jgi:hypothetical protein
VALEIKAFPQRILRFELPADSANQLASQRIIFVAPGVEEDEGGGLTPVRA